MPQRSPGPLGPPEQREGVVAGQAISSPAPSLSLLHLQWNGAQRTHLTGQGTCPWHGEPSMFQFLRGVLRACVGLLRSCKCHLGVSQQQPGPWAPHAARDQGSHHIMGLPDNLPNTKLCALSIFLEYKTLCRVYRIDTK